MLDNAFRACTSLQQADFPKATSIGHNAFLSCRNLQYIVLPEAINQPTRRHIELSPNTIVIPADHFDYSFWEYNPTLIAKLYSQGLELAKALLLFARPELTSFPELKEAILSTDLQTHQELHSILEQVPSQTSIKANKNTLPVDLLNKLSLKTTEASTQEKTTIQIKETDRVVSTKQYRAIAQIKAYLLKASNMSEEDFATVQSDIKDSHPLKPWHSIELERQKPQTKTEKATNQKALDCPSSQKVFEVFVNHLFLPPSKTKASANGVPSTDGVQKPAAIS